MGTAADQIDLIPTAHRRTSKRASGRTAAPPDPISPPRGTQAHLAGVLVVALLVAAAALPLMATRFAARSESPGWAIDAVRLRVEPLDTADRLLKLPEGAQMRVLGKPRNGFYPVSWGKIRAWVPTGAVETPAKNQTGGPRDRKARGIAQEIVAAAVIEVRSAASASAPTIGTIAKGDPVPVSGEWDNGFLQVSFGDGSGWVASDKLKARPTPPAKDAYKRSELISIINLAADRYGQNRGDMLRVARCESDLIPGAINAVGGSYGLFQFKPQTWARTPYASFDIFDPAANAMAAAWLWSQGGKREWVCQ